MVYASADNWVVAWCEGLSVSERYPVQAYHYRIEPDCGYYTFIVSVSYGVGIEN